MRWLTAAFAVLGSLASGGLGGWLFWRLVEGRASDLPLRLGLLLGVACAAAGAGVWAAVLALRRSPRTAWPLVLPAAAMILLALPDPGLTAIAFRLALLPGVAALMAFAAPPAGSAARQPAVRGFGAIATLALLIVAGVLPGFLRGRLMEAVRQGSTAEVARLVALGVEVEDVGLEGAMPLIVAVEAGDEAMVDLLLHLGASPYARDGSGRSAMMVSIARGSAGVTEKLVLAGSETEAGVSGGAGP